MKRFGLIALVAGLAGPAPSQAATAFQLWAQGHGVYVSSKARLTTWEDDLARLGLVPPPPLPAYRYRYDRQPDDLAAPPNY